MVSKLELVWVSIIIVPGNEMNELRKNLGDRVWLTSIPSKN